MTKQCETKGQHEQDYDDVRAGLHLLAEGAEAKTRRETALARLRDNAGKVPGLDADNAALLNELRQLDRWAHRYHHKDVAEALDQLLAEPRPGAELLERLNTAESERAALRERVAALEGMLATEEKERIRCRDGWAMSEARGQESLSSLHSLEEQGRRGRLRAEAATQRPRIPTPVPEVPALRAEPSAPEVVWEAPGSIRVVGPRGAEHAEARGLDGEWYDLNVGPWPNLLARALANATREQDSQLRAYPRLVDSVRLALGLLRDGPTGRVGDAIATLLDALTGVPHA